MRHSILVGTIAAAVAASAATAQTYTTSGQAKTDLTACVRANAALQPAGAAAAKASAKKAMDKCGTEAAKLNRAFAREFAGRGKSEAAARAEAKAARQAILKATETFITGNAGS